MLANAPQAQDCKQRIPVFKMNPYKQTDLPPTPLSRQLRNANLFIDPDALLHICQ